MTMKHLILSETTINEIIEALQLSSARWKIGMDPKLIPYSDDVIKNIKGQIGEK